MPFSRPAFMRRLATSMGAATLAVALILGAFVTTILPGASPARAQATPPSGTTVFSPEQKTAIETIIKEYLLSNPELFMEVQNQLETKMEQIQAEKLKSALKSNADEIFKRPDAPIAGNPKGDITVVEFFDYNCGYCKRAFNDISKLVEKDNKIKLVLKELPILSKGSEEGARIALAAKAQGKYWEVHRALLNLKGEINEQTGLRAVDKLGLDMARLKRDMDGPEVKAEIALVRDLAQKMGIQGTPHFLVGDRAIAGAPSNLLEQISGHVAELRKTGCSVC